MLLLGNQKGLFKSKLLPLHVAFLPNTKRVEYKIIIQFISIPFFAEQNIYAAKNKMLPSSLMLISGQ